MEKLAIVNGVKNEQTNTFEAPDESKFNIDNLEAIATDDDPEKVKPANTYAGQSFADGQLFVGHFDTDANHFVGDLVKVPAFTMPGDATPKNVNVDAQSGTISAK